MLDKQHLNTLEKSVSVHKCVICKKYVTSQTNHCQKKVKQRRRHVDVIDFIHVERTYTFESSQFNATFSQCNIYS